MLSTVSYSVALLKGWMVDLVAGFETEAISATRSHFDDGEYLAVRGDDALGKWLGVFLDAMNGSILADENHVERKIGVLHPHRDRFLFLIEEDHPLIVAKNAPEHQAHIAFLLLVGDFDRYGMRS